MKINKLILFSVTLVVVTGLLSSWYYQKARRDSQQINCLSTVKYYLKDNAIFDGSVGLILNADQTGGMAYSGDLIRTSHDQKLKILRIVYFKYKIEESGYVTLSNFTINKNISDEIQDDEFNKTIFDFSATSRRIKIKQLADDTYLIGNVFSPVFACVKED